jgi:hypothetical protein
MLRGTVFGMSKWHADFWAATFVLHGIHADREQQTRIHQLQDFGAPSYDESSYRDSALLSVTHVPTEIPD